MNRNFIIDKEINLNESDFLQTKTYADNLTRIINNTEQNKVFTIGLFGSWGSGKSSIIETSSKDFDQSKVKFISYDAWQYANDSFRRMFLRKIRKDLGFNETPLMKKFYENESADIDNKFQLSTTRLSFILAGLLLGIIVLWIIPIDNETKIPLYSIFSIISLFITILSGAFHQLKVSITKPLFFAPEQFEACFKEMISASLKTYKWCEKIVFTIVGDKTIKNLEKIVIVIDNIDRCNNDVAYNLLTDIKTFLSNDNYSIVFVIPIDDEALRKHLFRLNNHNDEDISVKEKEEFLRKFFNVILRIKPYQETDIFSFAQKVNEKHKLGFKNETLNLAAKEYSTNPRRVIQLFNNLISELSSYEETFSNKHETIICATIILREEFSEYYNEVVKAPKNFLDDDINIENEDPKQLRKLRFYRITRNIVNNINVADFSFILTNSNNQFNELSSDLKDAIISFDLEKLNNSIGNDYSFIFDYIAHQIRFCLNNRLNKDVTSYFDLVVGISQKHTLNFAINNRFIELFDQVQDLILENSNNYSDLCKYSLQLEEQGLVNFKFSIIKKVTNSNPGLDFWPKLFSAVIRNFQDYDSSIKLSDTFSKNFKTLNSEIIFSHYQYAHLITNTFLEEAVDQIENISQSSDLYKTLLVIFQNKTNVHTTVFENYFKRIVELSADFYNKSQEEIIEIIDYINPILEAIPNELLNQEHSNLESLYNSLLVRLVDNPSWPNNQSRANTLDLLSEGIIIEKDLVKFINFLLNIYRVTNNSISVVEQINKFSDHREVINPQLKKLIDQSLKLIPLKEFIVSDFGYNNSLSLNLLEYIMLLKENEEYCIDSVVANEKVNSILTYANENKVEITYELLRSLTKEKKFKNILIDIVVKQTTEFINQQPQFILEFAIQSFNSTNYKDFKDNYAFLNVIATKGDDSQIHCLVSILIDKIDSNENIEEIVQIGSQIKEMKNTEKNLLKSHLESFVEISDHHISGDLKESIFSLINKLKE